MLNALVRFASVDAEDLTSVDLLEEIRAALDRLEPLPLGCTIDIEMSRLRVLADPMVFRRACAAVIGYAVAHSEPSDAIIVRCAREEKRARIEVVTEDRYVAGADFPGLTSAAEELRAVGGEIGTGGSADDVLYWMTLPLASGASSPAGG